MEKIACLKDELLEIANKQDQKLLSVGGGARDVRFRPPIKTRSGHMVIVHLLVDVKDVMGANAVNSMVEAVSSKIEESTGSRVNLKIVSNLADKRLARSKAKFPIKNLGRERYSGNEIADRILSAYEFAYSDPYRATTHNKGIMNGIDAVLLATGQDFRAVEAGAHSYAAIKGRYTSLTTCKREGNFLVAQIELPIAVGIVGGVKDPKPDLAKKILGVKSSDEFARVLASVGLAQNFGAIRALSTEGIQKGHMLLHAKQIVKQIKAGKYEEAVLKELKRGPITFDRAIELLTKLKKN
jgi:hydroxymethylglutaryl-CoA reductase